MTAPKASKYTDAMAHLAALAEEGGEDGEKAKKAMKKLLAADKPEDDGDKKDEDKEAKAESSDEKKDDKKDEDAGAKAAAANPVLALGAQVQSLAARISAKEDAEERAKLMASRPDFTAEVSKSLEGQPLDQVKWAVANFPKGKIAPPVQAAAAAAQPEVRAVRGAGQGDQSDAPREGYSLDDLDVQMGLKPQANAIKHERNLLKLGVMTPDQARAHIAAQKAVVR